MKHLLGTVVYIGIGCAYQSTYDDVNVRQIATADVPLSTLGHIFAWPFVIMYHLLALVGWGIVAIAALACIVFGFFVYKAWRDKLAHQRRMRRPNLAQA